MGPHHLVLSSEVLDVDGCSHPEAAQFSPETGDLIACGSAVNKRDRLSRSVWVICGQFWTGVCYLRFFRDEESALICLICR